jgi:hypothetical protein
MFLNFAGDCAGYQPFALGAADLQWVNEARHPMTSRRLGRRPDCARQRAGEPENDKNDNHQPENAAESSAAVSSVSIIAAPAAQQNDDKNDKQNRHHDRLPSSLN